MDPMIQQDMMSSDEICTKSASPQVDNKKPRPADEQAQKCPRCDSTNTKFCYYNNYSFTQPRYFCKSCKRYWTKGGTLRNVPVGGACRKNNKRSSSSSDSSASSRVRTSDQTHHHHPQRPLIESNLSHSLLPDESTDFPLAFASLQNAQLGFDYDHDNHRVSVLGNYSNNVHGSFLDTLRCVNFLESPPMNNGLQNVYYGEEHHYGNVGNYTSHGEMGNLPYEDHMRGGSGGSSATSAVNVTTLKQDGRAEGCNESGEATTEDGEGGMMIGDVDAMGMQSSWINGFGSSNWHGYLDSPLM